ncbi:uncharacterized protein LODBEIA_P03660 [Lodderomyces beijingensis]|uniref:Ribosomal lysine N-methyltransferase 5 n=1 Tax=Lodderomyces beijingensis TaxID=1775926 RepID=A0ABP0ZFB1_9ASCO
MDERFLSRLECLTSDNLDEHIFELYSENAPPSNLGFLNKSVDTIAVTLPQSHTQLQINQSISQLSTRTTTSTTGFICWQVSVYLADWLLSDTCPIKLKKSYKVLELGAGVGGICASTLASKVGHYIATDQKHILKLLKQNIAANAGNFHSSTITVDTTSKKIPSRKLNAPTIIDVVEFDWEDIERGKYNLSQVAGEQRVEVVIACDTIYNEYLVEPFTNAMKALLTTPGSIAVVAVQLRDAVTMEHFVSALVSDSRLSVFTFPRHLLSEELQIGFEVYCVKLSGSS